jgi:hypothetical protein
MNRSGLIRSASSAVRKSATFSSTNCFVGTPSSAAFWAMFTECSSVPVRNFVSSPFIRCHRAITSAPMTSNSVWRPGLLFAYAIAVVM